MSKTFRFLFLLVAFSLLQTLAGSVVLKAQSFAAHSRLASGNWFMVAVDKTGVYRIGIAEVPALNGTPCEKIAVFGSTGNMLPVDNNGGIPDDLEPAAIRLVDVDANGLFDGNDYLLFYAEGPNVWRFDAGSAKFEYEVNPYTLSNYYFLTNTYSGDATTDNTLRLSLDETTVATNGDINEYTSVAVVNQEKVNPNNGGQVWVGDKFTAAVSEYHYDLAMPSLQPGATIQARYGFVSNSKQSAVFDVSVGNETRQHNFRNGNYYRTFDEQFTYSGSTPVRVLCHYRPQESSAVGYVDFIELNGLSPLSYEGGQLCLRNTQQISSGASCRFVVTGSPDALEAWDVTQAVQPKALQVTPSGNGFSFVAQTETVGTFLLFRPSDAYFPSSIEPVENQDLHGSDPVDYVIVAHRDFLDHAEQIADMHRLHDGMRVLVTTQEAVFNEFSSGKKDPIAIRQFLRCLKAKGLSQSDVVPRYLLLFGKGTFDNRDLLGAGLPTVVTYQNPVTYDFYDGASPSDDIFGFLDMDGSSSTITQLEVSIGRLPAKNKAEADRVVDKIVGYMEKHDLQRDDVRGDWRNYVCLLSDDADPSSSGDTNFVTSSEKTANLIKQRYPHFNIDRIYADAFIQQSGADGSYYPDVNNALRQRINYGCLLLNYIGHGSNQYIGTERYMQISDIEKYSNTDRLTFFVTSTCSFGRYDQVDEISGAEAFLLAPAAGVGVISAARPITHVQRFNTDVCLNALNPENTIGDALRLAKNTTSSSRTILLLGDPALHLSIPRNQAVVTTINGTPVCDSIVDSLQVLSTVTVEGEIRNSSGQLVSDFDGEIFPIVFDREVKCRTLANDNDSTEVDFVQQKNVLFKGRERVSGGRFCFKFIIPMDVSYRYGGAKISLYAKGGVDHATGQYDNLMFGGFSDTVEVGELHPTVELFINDTTFRDGAVTNETPTIYARLSDSVGINAAGSGLGHDITAILDNNPYSTITLNDFFEPDIADSRNGQVRYTLGKLSDGMHTLTLKCWNIFNFSGSATIRFNVVNDKTSTIANLCASPNPASDRTSLRMEHNLSNNVKSCRFDIYSAQGVLVKSFTPTPAEGSYAVVVDWDFTSEGGTKLPRGIYLLRATLTTADGDLMSETTKIVKH